MKEEQKIDQEEMLRLVASSAYTAYVNTLSGKNSPAQDFYYKRMSKPVVGDLVVETSSLCFYIRNCKSLINHIGRLESIKSEPYPDWEAEEGEDIPERNIWVIRTLDNRQFEWENCSFVAIPEQPYSHQGKL
jgi:hypothetical protein